MMNTEYSPPPPPTRDETVNVQGRQSWKSDVSSSISLPWTSSDPPPTPTQHSYPLCVTKNIRVGERE